MHSGLGYRSVCLFGWIRIVDDKQAKQRFCEALMEKYGKPQTKRPKGFFPRIDAITVYAIAVERMTGKEQSLPPLSEQWPAKDRTKTPRTVANYSDTAGLARVGCTGGKAMPDRSTRIARSERRRPSQLMRGRA